MELEWDPVQAEIQRRKLGLDLADCASVLSDERAITVSDPPDEERRVTIGSDVLGRVLVVEYGCRGDRIRVLSARPATQTEKRQYEASK